eukprot:SRR837773.4432.p1 GENE.SRR837773.4432~~SRR837773.4432.p1  ORF type:complete len:417 (-),score=87.10 SRR837773.4432:166-1350(-)
MGRLRKHFPGLAESDADPLQEEVAAAGDGKGEESTPRTPSTDCYVGPSTAQLEILNKAVKSWNFDVIEFAELTSNRPLTVSFDFLFDHFDTIARLGLDRQKLCSFANALESGYHESNPYHNRVHAASVLHSMHSLMSHGGFAELAHREGEGLTLEEIRVAGWVAAAAHDYDHLGFTNDFLIKTGHERAVFYNDQHVNEQHHAAQAFALLKQAENDFLESRLSAETFRQFRALVIQLVLATDMADHGRIVKSFTALIDERKQSQQGETDVAVFKPRTAEESSLTLQVAIKVADLGHLAMEWPMHLKWVDCLEREFFAQGDMESALGMSVSFLMDRNKPGPSQTQVGFYDFMVLPLFRVLVSASSAAEPVLRAAEANREQWKALDDARQAESVKDK